MNFPTCTSCKFFDEVCSKGFLTKKDFPACRGWEEREEDDELKKISR